MEILTSKTVRHNTRLRVRLPITLTSLDRRHAFAAECVALIVSPQGAGVESPQSLPLETPVMISGLPGGASASCRVASCVPLGHDGKRFLVGVSLYNPGNVWGITNPPPDWEVPPPGAAAADRTTREAPAIKAANSAAATPDIRNSWPYNIFSGHTEAHRHNK